MGQIMGKSMAKKPDLLLGRKTYDIFAAFWPYHKDEPGADNLNSTKKYVVSKTLSKVDRENSTLIKGDVVKEITRLKGEDGPELQVTIGKGKRLFGEGINPSGFKLVDSKASSTGVIMATFALSGDLKTGSFA